MRIDPNLTRVAGGTAADRVERQQADGVQGRGSQVSAAQGARADEAVLSPLAQDVLTAQRALAQVPDIRQDRVAELKSQIASGTYQVDSRAVADKIVSGGFA